MFFHAMLVVINLSFQPKPQATPRVEPVTYQPLVCQPSSLGPNMLHCSAR